MNVEVKHFREKDMKREEDREREENNLALEVKQLREENRSLMKRENSRLRDELGRLREENSKLRQENGTMLKDEICRLRGLVKELESSRNGSKRKSLPESEEEEEPTKRRRGSEEEEDEDEDEGEGEVSERRENRLKLFSHKKDQFAGCVGKRVGIYWKDDDKYYYGKLVSRNDSNTIFHITYNDGMKELLDLSREKLNWNRNKYKINGNFDGCEGKKVGVWWKDDWCYYYGRLICRNYSKAVFQISYDDGTKELIDLSREKVDWSKAEEKQDRDQLADCVGRRVGIWWRDDHTFYYGSILRRKYSKFQILYDDGMKEWLDLSKEKLKWT